MNVTINGKNSQLTPDLSVAGLIEKLHEGEAPQGIAVALNGAVVRRSSWETIQLSCGDTVEILQAVSGG